MLATRSSRRRRWLPRWTLRLRLTLLYGGLFLLAGTVLLGITYALVAHDTSTVAAKNFVVSRRAGSGTVLPAPPALNASPKDSGFVYQAQATPVPTSQLRDYAGKVQMTFRRITAAQAAQVGALAARANRRISQEHTTQMSTLLTESGIALAIMAVLSIALGWLVAGRALRPLRVMNGRAKGISERNLHERLALAGPNDELKELGDTFDGLLARLESAFESQRRFVANASHELRTPITFERTLVEVTLADPNASARSLRETCQRVLAAGQQQERLIEALLTLARSQRGLEQRENIDLAAIVAEVARGRPPSDIRVELELEEARSAGDPALVERLVSNLLDNAFNYNRPGGWVRATTGMSGGMPMLRVANTGPEIDPDLVGTLLEPFRRDEQDRAANGRRKGLGLGLSIVAAIADAHGARLEVVPRAEGGLRIEVRFPPVAGPVPGPEAMSFPGSTLAPDGTA